MCVYLNGLFCVYLYPVSVIYILIYLIRKTKHCNAYRNILLLLSPPIICAVASHMLFLMFLMFELGETFQIHFRWYAMEFTRSKCSIARICSSVYKRAIVHQEILPQFVVALWCVCVCFACGKYRLILRLHTCSTSHLGSEDCMVKCMQLLMG